MSTPLNLPIGSYRLPVTADGPARIEWVGSVLHGHELWAVRGNGLCLSRALEWDHEPLPSSSLRTVEWYHQHRFTSAEEAYTYWRRWYRRVAREDQEPPHAA